MVSSPDSAKYISSIIVPLKSLAFKYTWKLTDCVWKIGTVAYKTY